MSTAACVERDHLPRRRRRHPPLPGLPDRAAGRALDLPRGRLPPAPRRAAHDRAVRASGATTITYHTFIHENMRKRFMEGFHYDAHPMGMLVSAVAAMSTFYPDAKDIYDPDNRAQADRAAHRQDADARRVLPSLLRRHAVRVPRQLDCPFAANFLRHDVRTVEQRAVARPGARPRRSTCCSSSTPTTSRTAARRRCGSSARPTPTRTRRARPRARRSTARSTAAPTSRSSACSPRSGRSTTSPAFMTSVKEGRRPAPGLRPPRVQELRPAGHDHQADRRRGVRGDGQEPAARHRAQARRGRAEATSTSPAASSTRTSTSTRASSTRRWASRSTCSPCCSPSPARPGG